MKVLLINGSPRQNGNTTLALNEVAQQLATEGIDTEILWIGNKPIRGCIACNQCAIQSLGRCLFDDDICNRISEKFADADLIGIPVRITVGRKAKDSDEVILTVVAYPNYEKLPSGVSEEVIHETIYKQIMQINRRLPSFKQMKALELRSTEFEKTTSKKIKRHLVK